MPTPPSIEIEVFGRSDVGLVRERNEDAILIFDRRADREIISDDVVSKTVGTEGLVLAVFDGMGGAAAGDIASRIGREMLVSNLTGGEIAGSQALAERMGLAVVSAHREIRRFASHHEDSLGMGTTITSAGFWGRSLIMTHVGDSRAYVYRGTLLTQLTEDHSLVQELVSEGHISQQEAGSFIHSNVILQALGVNGKVYPSIAVGEVVDGDIFLLCSDGLTDLVDSAAIGACLRGSDLREMAAELVRVAELGGGFDNISVVLARIVSGAPPKTSSATDPSDTFEMRPVRVSTAPVSRRSGSPSRGRGCAALVLFVISAIVVAFTLWGKT